MIVIVLTNCPEGLRGHLTLWLMEVKAGVFVGKVSARIREALWTRVTELCKDGDALMIQSAPNEQGMLLTTHKHKWQAVDREGVTLMRRPPPGGSANPRMRPGWSKAAKIRKYGGKIRRQTNPDK